MVIDQQVVGHPEEFTRRYKGLVDHYGIVPCRTNPNSHMRMEKWRTAITASKRRLIRP